MQDKLAILIVGSSNAGKTTTFKFFCEKYFHKKVSTFKLGWRYGGTPFSPKYEGVKMNAYFIPSSPTEKNTSFIDIIEELDWYPEFLFVAEQLNGAQYQDTIDSLRNLDYHIKEFLLDETNPDTVWHFYKKNQEAQIQNYRTEQIAEYVRRFILSRI